jgi:hypothetical protein
VDHNIKVKLDLLIPYLLTPPAVTADLSSCKILETVLSRSVMTQAKIDYHSQLFSLLNIPVDTSPAFLSGLADGCEPAFRYWRADPVHFQAQSDHALLRDGQSLAITQAEAAQLVAAFNQHFATDGVQLFAATPQRWYLQSQQQLLLTTTPVTQAISRNVRHFLPVGADAIRWRKVLNETQMLFYAHDVNQQREASGQLTINSLWLWGEGHHDSIPSATSPVIFVDEILARGAARFLNTACSSCEDWMHNPVPGVLVIDDLVLATSYGDAEEWQRGFDNICQNILPAIMRALKSGKIKQINLYAADGRCFRLAASDLRKFWRWRKPLSYWTQHAN